MTVPYGWPQQAQPAGGAFPPPQFPQQQPLAPSPQWPQQYPPQPQYAQYTPQPAPAGPPLAKGSLDDFFSQPSAGGGKALTFDRLGASHIGIVARPITAGDIQQQTDTRGAPQTFRDGRPKFVMTVPLHINPTAAHPDGRATWYVKGQARDELVRAMSEAGAPAGPPEAGALIQVTFSSERPSGPGMNPAKLFTINYRRPDGSAPVAAAPVAPAPAPAVPSPAPAVPSPAPAMPVPAQAPGIDWSQVGAQPAQQLVANPAVVHSFAATAPVAQALAAAAPPAPGAVAPQAPEGLDAAQQALLARLTGQTAS